MKLADIENLENGLYTVYWKEENGSSLCALGSLFSGEKWLAPSNWTSKLHQNTTVAVDVYIANNIESIVPIQVVKKDKLLEPIEIKIQPIAIATDNPTCENCMFEYSAIQEEGNCTDMREALGLPNCHGEYNLIFKNYKG